MIYLSLALSAVVGAILGIAGAVYLVRSAQDRVFE